MTGYGESYCIDGNYRISVSIKSLNSKLADITATLPESYEQIDLKIRKVLLKKMIRGKIQFVLKEEVEKKEDYRLKQVKKKLELWKTVKKEIGKKKSKEIKELLFNDNSLFSVEGKVSKQKQEKLNTLVLNKLLLEALEKIDIYRLNEGKSLKKDIVKNLTSIKTNLDKIEKITKNNITQTHKKQKELLEKSLDKNIKIHESRLEQEIIHIVNKSDINEEIIRLRNHIKLFEKTISAKGYAKGRKLSFIAQEILREINTIGSKSNETEMFQLVVLIKNSQDKIKEQLANVL